MVVIAIEVSYENSRVEQYFTDYDKMGAKIGVNETKTVKLRINQLCAAISFHEYLKLNLGKPHSLIGDLSDYYGISITGNIRLIVRPLCDNRTPEMLKVCIKCEVKGVVKYHERKNEWLIS